MSLYVILRTYTTPDGPWAGDVEHVIFGSDDFGGDVFTERADADRRCVELHLSNGWRGDRVGGPMNYQVAELKICA